MKIRSEAPCPKCFSKDFDSDAQRNPRTNGVTGWTLKCSKCKWKHELCGVDEREALEIWGELFEESLRVAKDGRCGHGGTHRYFFPGVGGVKPWCEKCMEDIALEP